MRLIESFSYIAMHEDKCLAVATSLVNKYVDEVGVCLEGTVVPPVHMTDC